MYPSLRVDRAVPRAAVYRPPTADAKWPLGKVLALKPTETLYGDTWAHVRRDFEINHPVVMAGLRKDLAQRGIVTPIRVDLDHGTVRNGHHRVLAAQDVGLAVVPVMFHDGDENTWWWDPDTREHILALRPVRLAG